MNNIFRRSITRLASGSCAAVLAASASLFAAAVPASAQAAPTLTCSVTPDGTTSTSSCSATWPHPAYNANFIVSGLPAGTYTYAWSTAGALPQPISCSTAICNQDLDTDHQDVREKVTVIATNTVTHATYTLTVRVGIFAYCGPGYC